MGAAEKRTFSLPKEQTSSIDNLVAMDKWLREEVVPAAIAIQTNPNRALPAEQVFEDIRALHAKRMGCDGSDT